MRTKDLTGAAGWRSSEKVVTAGGAKSMMSGEARTERVMLRMSATVGLPLKEVGAGVNGRAQVRVIRYAGLMAELARAAG